MLRGHQVDTARKCCGERVGTSWPALHHSEQTTQGHMFALPVWTAWHRANVQIVGARFRGGDRHNGGGAGRLADRRAAGWRGWGTGAPVQWRSAFPGATADEVGRVRGDRQWFWCRQRSSARARPSPPTMLTIRRLGSEHRRYHGQSESEEYCHTRILSAKIAYFVSETMTTNGATFVSVAA